MPDELAQPRLPRDLAAVLFALCLPTAITWLYFFEARDWPAAAQVGVVAVVKVIQFALPIVWVWAVHKGRATLRLPSANGVVVGLAFGVLVAGAMFALYFGALRGSELINAAAPAIRGKVAGAGIDGVAKYAA